MNPSVITSITTLLISAIHYADASSAYLYYKQAQCGSGSYIKGEFYYAFDSYKMKGQGFRIKNYNGPCKYFENGRYDLEYADNDGNFMKNGYCIRCNGMIGCTSVKNSCNYFSTSIPSNSYTLSDNSTSADDENDGVESGYEDDDESSSQIQQFQDASYQEVARYDNADSSTGYYSLFGVIGAMISMMALFTASRAGRRLQQKDAFIGDTSIESSVTNYQGGITA